MALPVWPLALPQAVKIGFRKFRDPNLVRVSRTSKGPPKRIKNYTGVIYYYEVSIPEITAAQKTTLEAFYETGVNCVDPFEWKKIEDGSAGAVTVYRFAPEFGEPDFEEAGGGRYSCSFVLEYRP